MPAAFARQAVGLQHAHCACCKSDLQQTERTVQSTVRCKPAVCRLCAAQPTVSLLYVCCAPSAQQNLIL